MRRMKVAIIGAAGAVASVCIDALVRRDAQIVAGFGRKTGLGEDIGTVAGLEPIGVAISTIEDLEKVLDTAMPDAAIDCTLNTIEEIFPHAKACMERGINYMPVGICCYYPFLTDPELAKELHEIGKRTGASYLGSGSGEGWQSLPLVLSGLSNSLRHVRLSFNALLNDFGAGSFEGMGFGEPEENWAPYLEVSEPSPWEHVDRLFAEKAGLHVSGIDVTNTAEAAPFDMHPCEGSDFTIPKGTLSGYLERTVVHTEEGVDVESLSYFKFGLPGETNSFTVEIEGDPDFKMTVENFHGEITTSTIMVNRLPDLIRAPGGIAMVNDLPLLTYKSAGAFLVEV